MSDLPPANWYPDPEVPGQQRYWDGTQWTEHRAPGAGAEASQPTTSAQPTQAPTQDGGSTAPQWGQPQAGQQPPGQPQGQQAWGGTPAQQTWGQQGYAQPAAGGTNGMAIASLVVAIVSFFLAFIVIGALGGVVAVVLGIVAMKRVKESGGTQGGRGLAISGIVVGGLSILIGVALLVVFTFIGSAIEQGGPVFTDFFECIEEEARTGQDLDC